MERALLPTLTLGSLLVLDSQPYDSPKERALHARSTTKTNATAEGLPWRFVSFRASRPSFRS